MPIELILGPFMRPVVRAQALIMGVHRADSHYTPTIVDAMGSTPTKFTIRKEFGTGSKIFAVFTDSQQRTYADSVYHMTRSRAVKGAYRMYEQGSDKPIATLRAGLRSNVLLFKTVDNSELELGWHVINHKVDALDDYRVFQLSDGNTYQWTYKGHFLERVHNYGQMEAELRERVGYVNVLPERRGFDLYVNEDIVQREMAIATAMICYIEAWNTLKAYGGIYKASHYSPLLPWKRE